MEDRATKSPIILNTMVLTDRFIPALTNVMFVRQEMCTEFWLKNRIEIDLWSEL
jgi:hypothetical protein